MRTNPESGMTPSIAWLDFRRLFIRFGSHVNFNLPDSEAGTFRREWSEMHRLRMSGSQIVYPSSYTT